MPPEVFIASHSTNVDLPIWKKKTNKVEPSKEKEVPLVSSLRGTSTKNSNPGMEELNQVNPTAAIGVKPSAAFENHDHAVTHKEKYAAAKNSNAESNEMNRANTTVALKKDSGINLSQVPEDSVGRSAYCIIWTCDVCKAATFDNMFNLVAHEEKCDIANRKSRNDIIKQERCGSIQSIQRECQISPC
jgi:hypothetical protein